MKLHISINRFVFFYLPLLLIIIAPALPYDNFVFALGGALILIGNGRLNKNSFSKMRLFPIFLYIVYTFLVTFINMDYLGSYWIQGLKNTVLMLILFVLLNILFNKIKIEEFLRFSERFFIVIGAMGLIELAFRFPIWEYILTFKVNEYVANSIHTDQYRCVNLFAHPIMYAVYLGVGIIFIAYKERNNLRKLFLIEGILAVNLISTQSRSSMIALLVLAAFLGIKNLIKTITRVKIKRGIRRLLISAVIIGCVVIVYFIFIRSGLSDIFTSVIFRFQHMLDAGQAGGEIVRVEIARRIFNYFPKHLFHLIFGRGLYAGTAYLSAYPIYKGSWMWNQGIDNQYITILFESGIIGVVLFGSAFIKELLYIKKHKNPICSRCFSIQLFFLLVSFFYESLLFMSTFVLIIILLLTFDLAKRSHTVEGKGGTFNATRIGISR